MSNRSPHQAPSDRARIRRAPRNADYDPARVREILAAGWVAHVAIELDGQPFVLPMAYGLSDDELYLHGSTVSRLMIRLAEGAPASVGVTLIDGLVLARSLFHHSMNYRSVTVLGRCRPVTEPDEKLAALEAISEHVAPGRWDEARFPNEKELKATLVVAIPLAEASAKVREGAPIDEPEDLELDVWAGVLPMRTTFGEPVPAPELSGNEAPPICLASARLGG